MRTDRLSAQWQEYTPTITGGSFTKVDEPDSTPTRPRLRPIQAFALPTKWRMRKNNSYKIWEEER